MNHEAPELLRQISRREKSAFIWTGVWTAGGLLGLGGTFALGRWIGAEFTKHRDLDELHRIVDKALPWQIACSVTLVISALGFLISGIRWLLAIRKRRRLETALFPHR